jgi:hypothetical protein
MYPTIEHPTVLPDCRPKVQRNIVHHVGLNWTPIYCANCGADGGLVPEDNCNFAFYLCNSCAEKWSPVEGTYMVPDEVFWQRLLEEQMNTFGRVLTDDEMHTELQNENSVLFKLGKDRKDFNKVKMS